MNQNGLSLVELCFVDQRLPRGERGQWHGRGFGERDRLRFSRSLFIRNDCVFRVPAASIQIKIRIDGIAGFVLVDLRAGFLDNPGHIRAGRERRL